ncbi:MAG: thiamine phosphate synthase [Candidatus Margulisiibacteriota bacterium]
MRYLLPDFNIYPVISQNFCRNGSAVQTLYELIEGGIKIVQLREKERPKKHVFDLAEQFRKITAKAGVTLIINDYLDIALDIKADGVHLGQRDFPCHAARKVAPDMIIGVSTHNLDQALRAEQNGASYINIGPIFPTRTKITGIDPLGPNIISTIAAKIKIPFTVMGGIKKHHIPQLLEAGAKQIAMVTELTQAEDIPGKVRELQAMFNER